MSGQFKCGHERTPENTSHDVYWHRDRCKECRRVRGRLRYYQRKGVRLTAAQFAKTGKKAAQARKG